MKAIYKAKGAAAEYSAWGCNLYVGCSHDCSYCYNKRGVFKHAMGGAKPQLKACFKDEGDAYNTFVKELTQHGDEIVEDGGIFFSFSTDPMLAEEINLTMACVYLAGTNGVPVQILTKATEWTCNVGVMETLYSVRKFVRVGFTLTGHDELEPGAPSNADRTEALRRLHLSCIPTFASIEPVVDFAASLECILNAIPYCKEFRIGLMSPYSKKRYDWQECDRFINKVNELAFTQNLKIYYKDSIRRFHSEI